MISLLSNQLAEIELEYTELFPQILQQQQCSLLITTYQKGLGIVVGVQNSELQVSYLDLPLAMGIAVNEKCIAIGAGRQVHFIYPAHQVLEEDWKGSPYDGAFIFRSSIHTGGIQSHELAWGSEGLWVVNTLFSCLCTLGEDVCFQPKWKPHFIDQLGAHDCCHLNGLSMRDGQPAYVTMVAPTSAPGAWRSRKVDGGCVYDVPRNESIVSGLAMPHSPRWYANRLWVLNSGNGEFGFVDIERSKFVPVEYLPGFLRGLSFAERFAFVGLSNIRESNLFGGLRIAENASSLRCGVGVVDLSTGRTVAVLKINSGIDEIFAVEVLNGFANPLFSGSLQNGKEREIWLT